MKKTTLFVLLLSICSFAGIEKSFSQTVAGMEPIKLNQPDKKRGTAVMEALAKRQSTKECSDKMLSLQDLSDLLWAANGINRPESGKRTAPSAMNRQDVKVYVCTAEGSYLYNHKTHTLEPVSSGDVRPAKAPVCLVLVTDANETWSAIDAGIVSQNISLFCAGTGIATYPRATMNREELTKALKLTGTQTLMLCHPTGYFK
ncbi:nitroreductase family protein [Parabacteroides pacaensis]|uniref:nitroreductase family protein n=1 Tax=Parabacteroides pacaensis TaxID=2086575 RepID=UPI000D0EE9F6